LWALLPYVVSVSPNAREQLKRLLGAISTTVPYVPNLSRLAEMMLITDHRTLLKYLHLLDGAALITLLRSEGKGNKIIQKPDKIYLNNTNLSRALGLTESNIGTDRETFFLSQVSVVGQVRYSKKGDFLHPFISRSPVAFRNGPFNIVVGAFSLAAFAMQAV